MEQAWNTPILRGFGRFGRVQVKGLASKPPVRSHRTAKPTESTGFERKYD